MVNVPELRKVLEFIDSNPEKHHQGWWSTIHNVGSDQIEVIENSGWYSQSVATEEAIWKCDTYGCVAGWTAMLHGWRPVLTEDGNVFRKDKGFHHASVVATEILGLNSEQAEALYSGANSLWELWHIAHDITNGEIEIPEEYK